MWTDTSAGPAEELFQGAYPRSYLYTIAANLVRDHWRKTERERRALRRVTAAEAADEPVADRRYPAAGGGGGGDRDRAPRLARRRVA